ncbi:MAG: polymerase sigma factor RpoE [bacterium]|nr:polymerase sigma factor RpoE [bacterium]
MSADANDEAELVALVIRAQRRDPSAEAELFERFAGKLAGILERLLGSVADAEDALQDTFVIALSQLGRLRDPALAGSWLTGIAVHQAQRRFRRRRLLRVFGLDRGVRDAGLAELAAITTPPEVRETLRRLDGFLAELAPSLRLAWMLRNVEGESLTEIARACHCSLATAKRRIATADKRLRKQLNIGDEP